MEAREGEDLCLCRTEISFSRQLRKNNENNTDMKTMQTIKVLLLSCLVAVGFSACDNDDYDTQQYKGGVSLNVFGPSPVMRGGTLRFLGSNLDQVTQVIIPGVSPITDIDVRQAGVPSEILVQVPVDGPEVGYVTLVTANGTEITTQTQLTYEEPIVFEGFSPASVMPGEVLTITGDYLNLMHEVIFAEDVAVPEDDFITHTRYEITLVVPDAAQTGQIILSDGVEDLPNWIYSEAELEVGMPTVESMITETRYKAGETVTITGTYLNLAAYVRFAAAAEEPYDFPAADLAEEGAASFSVNEEGTQITFALPAEAPSGAVELVLRSGLTVPVMEELETVKPTGLSVTQTAVKNGTDLTVTGTDMDLVVSATFPNVEEAVPLKEVTAGRVVVTVPDMAQSGDLLLNLASGESVTVAYQTLKPTITAFNPAALTAGEEVTITGTDFDVVAAVVFEGEGEGNTTVEIVTEEDRKAFIKEQEEALKQNPDMEVAPIPEVNYVDEKTLKITVPITAASCAPTLMMRNGEKVETTVTLNITPATDPVVTAITPGSVKSGEVITVTGLNINTVENFYFGDVKVTEYGTRTSTEVTLTVPAEVEPGTYYLRMINYAGSEIISDVPVIIEAAEVEIWTGSLAFGAWANGMQDLAWGGCDFSNIAAGTVINVYFTADTSATSWQLKIGRGTDWSTLPDFRVYAGGADAVDVNVTDTMFSYTFGANDVEEILNNQGLIFQGANLTLTRVTLIY